MRWGWLFLLVACSGSDEQVDDTGAVVDAELDITQPGPYAVGTTDHAVENSSGQSMQVQIWYPSSDEPVAVHKYGGLLPAEAAYDLLTPDCSEARPVVVFSHGYSGIRWQSPFFAEHLASHGYVVVAPDHVKNTFLDLDDLAFGEVLVRRPVDVSDAFDFALSADSGVADCLDPNDGYAVSGHSFGGYTAFAVGGAPVQPALGAAQDLSDSRAWAVVPLAPWDAGGAISGDATASIAIPTLVIGGSEDATTPWSMVRGLYNGLTVGERHLLKLVDAGHYSFSAIGCDTIGAGGGDGCGDDFMPIADAEAYTEQAALGFLELVRGNPKAEAVFPLEASDDLVWRSGDAAP